MSKLVNLAWWAAGAMTGASLLFAWKAYAPAKQDSRPLEREVVALRSDLDRMAAERRLDMTGPSVDRLGPDEHRGSAASSSALLPLPSGPSVGSANPSSADFDAERAATARALDDRLRLGRIDGAATAAATRRVGDFLATGPEGARIGEASCNDTFCKIEVIFRSDADRLAFSQRVLQAPPFPDDTFYRHEVTANGATTSIYAAREGQTLAPLP